MIEQITLVARYLTIPQKPRETTKKRDTVSKILQKLIPK